MVSASVKPLNQNAVKPKVVRIIGRLNVGGPARQVCFLHQALRDNFDTILIAGHLDENEGDMSYLLASGEGVRWIRSMSRPIRLWSDFLAFLRIVRILRVERARSSTYSCRQGWYPRPRGRRHSGRAGAGSHLPRACVSRIFWPVSNPNLASNTC